jgi:hypothetical protein
MTHIIDLLSEERCATWIGLEAETKNLFEDGAPATAERCRELLDEANARWERYVTATDDAKFFDVIGPIGRGYASETRCAFVLHIIDELIHHAAEVGVLRDIYRAQRTHDPALSALLHGEEISSKDLEALKQSRPDLVREAAALAYWNAIPRLLALGFAPALEGRSALHHAAANGRIELMQVLIDAGASVDARDPVYKATPAEWADYMGSKEAAEFLRRIPV